MHCKREGAKRKQIENWYLSFITSDFEWCEYVPNFFWVPGPYSNVCVCVVVVVGGNVFFLVSSEARQSQIWEREALPVPGQGLTVNSQE